MAIIVVRNCHPDIKKNYDVPIYIVRLLANDVQVNIQ